VYVCVFCAHVAVNYPKFIFIAYFVIMSIFGEKKYYNFGGIWCVCCLQGPFATFKMQQDKDCDWTGLKFSPDGKLILISTNGQVIRLIDAFQGTPLQTFTVSTITVVILF